MPTDELAQAIENSRRGAHLAASNKSDHAELATVARLIACALEAEDSVVLAELERRVRLEVPEALPWFLSILRTFSGSAVESATIQHLALIPIMSRTQGCLVNLEHSAHEIAGALEYALDLGPGSLRLLPQVASITSIEAASPVTWRRITEGVPGAEASLLDPVLKDGWGAIIGLWTVGRTDRARLARKFVHATQRTPELISWQRRTEALLEESSSGGQFSIYPVMQLQDFFAGFRQIQLVHALESAFHEVPQAHALKWEWIDTCVRCTLSDTTGHTRFIEARFPDEPREFAQMRIAAFCTRRGVFADPQLPMT